MEDSASSSSVSAAATVGMTGDNPVSDESEYEYEYEYDEAETESFYINLDLTSCNGVIRPPRARGRAKGPSSKSASNRSANDSPSTSSESSDDEMEAPEPDTASQSQIQVMDLHTHNPIVSYRNQVFSCSWTDMIGTELLFSHPEGRSDLPLVRQNKDFDLIAANRVKILGQKGTLAASSYDYSYDPEPENIQTQAVSAVEGSTPTPGLNQNRKRPLTNQKRFLERLMDAKRARGEPDAVRKVFRLKHSENFESRLRGWARTEERMAEFERLNRLVLEGDLNAAIQLEEIYNGLEEASNTDDDDDNDDDDGVDEGNNLRVHH